MIYEIKLKLLTATGTPFQADTIWGHLAWQIRYLRGEEELTRFLRSYPETPTLISNGFPDGFLPMPILPPLHAEEMEKLITEFFGDTASDRLRGGDVIKKIKKTAFIPEEILLTAGTPVSSYYIYKQLLQIDREKRKTLTKEVLLTAHNTINRWGSSEEGGNLFYTEDTFYPKSAPIRIFVQSDFFTAKELEELFTAIGLSGYGRDASTGKGAFGDVTVSRSEIDFDRKGNAIMSLSNFVPSANLPQKGYYDLMTKYGKLGGIHVLEKETPFKKPLAMMKAGSIFLTGDTQQAYGALIRDIHFTDKEIVQYAYLFPLPVNLKNGGWES